jgi:hypothetical protein
MVESVDDDVSEGEEIDDDVENKFSGANGGSNGSGDGHSSDRDLADDIEQGDGQVESESVKKRGRPKKIAMSLVDELVMRHAYGYYDGLAEAFPDLADFDSTAILAVENKTGALDAACRTWVLSEEVEMFKFVMEDPARKNRNAHVANQMAEVSRRRTYTADIIRDRVRAVVNEFKVAQSLVHGRISGAGDLRLTAHGDNIAEYIQMEDDSSEASAFAFICMFADQLLTHRRLFTCAQSPLSRPRRRTRNAEKST